MQPLAVLAHESIRVGNANLGFLCLLLQNALVRLGERKERHAVETQPQGHAPALVDVWVVHERGVVPAQAEEPD